jgi:hypothetical protein
LKSLSYSGRSPCSAALPATAAQIDDYRPFRGCVQAKRPGGKMGIFRIAQKSAIDLP